jgi:heme-degrading monooxygenase HmoA
MNQHYASGEWKVKPGKEEEFITRWAAFAAWTKGSGAGLETIALIRDVDEPRHFVSYSIWTDAESRAAWKSRDGFKQRLDACVELCESFHGGDFRLASSPALVG